MTHTLDTPTHRFGAVPPVPPPEAPPPRRFLRTLGAAAVALAVAGGVAGVLDGLGPAGSENRYQPVSYAGDNPFASPVGTDRPGVAPIAGGGGAQDGDTPEMYAADPADPSCDASQLLAELQSDPARAAVWAQVQRIAPDRIPDFVAGLSPVVLRTETAVVDHGFAGGRSVPTPSVLAAGTAVFVNSYGQPVVKCFSGNPLTPGTSTDPAVTTVRPTTAPIATYAFHDPVARGPVAAPGKPDTTGSGPTPLPVEADGGIGGGIGGGDVGAPIPVEPDGGIGGAPGTPDPAPSAPATPLYGDFNYDGSVTLSDGRIQRPDGSIVPLPKRGPDTTGLPDGGWRDKDGLYYNRDGSRRDLLMIYGIEGVQDFYLTPEGKIVNGDNREFDLTPGHFIVRNYDGSVSYVNLYSAPGEDYIAVTRNDGSKGPLVKGDYSGGILTNTSGKVVNHTGTVREPVTIPGGGVVIPTGGTIPPAPAPTPGQNGQPLPADGGGVVGPTTTPAVPLDPAGLPAPAGEDGAAAPETDAGTTGSSGSGDAEGAPATGDGGAVTDAGGESAAG